MPLKEIKKICCQFEWWNRDLILLKINPVRGWVKSDYMNETSTANNTMHYTLWGKASLRKGSFVLVVGYFWYSGGEQYHYTSFTQSPRVFLISAFLALSIQWDCLADYDKFHIAIRPKKKLLCCPLPTDRKMWKNRVGRSGFFFFFFFFLCTTIWAKNLLKFVFNGSKWGKHLHDLYMQFGLHKSCPSAFPI